MENANTPMRTDEDTRADIHPYSPSREPTNWCWRIRGLNAERDCEREHEAIWPRRLTDGHTAACFDGRDRVVQRQCCQQRDGSVGVPRRDQARCCLCAVIARDAVPRQLWRAAVLVAGCMVFGHVVMPCMVPGGPYRRRHRLRLARNLTDLQRDGCAHHDERNDEREEPLDHRVEYTAHSNAST